jgi:hypothetical protein
MLAGGISTPTDDKKSNVPVIGCWHSISDYEYCKGRTEDYKRPAYVPWTTWKNAYSPVRKTVGGIFYTIFQFRSNGFNFM